VILQLTIYLVEHKVH